ncbi:hypothetical protein [Rossellomorea vietnamensis]|uniref:hypothetical protein n=1 Tax=Rossellomorea vietnamensis TaxID=218284 RepID=UPI003CE89116
MEANLKIATKFTKAALLKEASTGFLEKRLLLLSISVAAINVPFGPMQERHAPTKENMGDITERERWDKGRENSSS